MKKHLAPWLVALAALTGLVILTSPASAGRPACDGLTATTWTIVDGFGDIRFIIGTPGNDVLVAGDLGDDHRLVIFGMAGNDVVCGSDHDDVILGGPGHDVIHGRLGADVIRGGDGNDALAGGAGADVIRGGNGHDFIAGGGGRNRAFGGAGIDVIRGRSDAWGQRKKETPQPTSTPSAVPTATPTPEPPIVLDLTPTPAPAPTASVAPPTVTPAPTPTPAPTATQPPTPGTGSFPGNHAESLAVIRNASATATERKAIVWDLFKTMNFPLHDGNPYEYTPSSALVFENFVHHRGSQYGPDKGRGPTGGVFHETCQFSHLAYDDPIVFPGQPGRSHLHMFFGNTHTNAYSTADTILNEGGSTCSRGELNRTSYWIPAAFDGDGEVLVPDQFMVYYESYDAEWNTLQPFPEGLKLVHGNAMATSVQPNIPNYGAPAIVWKCGWYTSAQLGRGGSSGPYQSTPPNCADGQYSHIEMQLKWPFCWDGQSTDSTNHQSHVVFPQAGAGFFYPGTCPATHPITLPRITYRVHFNTTTMSSPTSEILLASDINPTTGAHAPHGVSGHGDWFGGWNRELLRGLVDRCILTGEECDEMHYGTPGGEQAAATLLEARTISPQQVLEYCPLRREFSGDLHDLAYCRE